MRDGRSSAPPLPDNFEWILRTRTVNRVLGSNYTLEQVQAMDADTMLKIMLFARYV